MPTGSIVGIMRRHPVVAFFVLAYALSWLLWVPLWLPAVGGPHLPTLPHHHFLGAFGPLAAAFVVTGTLGGRKACLELLRSMAAWRGRGGWAVLAVAAPLVLVALAVVGVGMAESRSPDLSGLGRSPEFPALGLGGLLLLNVLTFGFGEEVGWRGFALPRLQARWTAWRSTLVLTLWWAGWHVPLFLYRPGYAAMGPGAVAGWLVSLLTGAVLLTWLYNSSRGSLLVVALFHASVDVAFTSDLASPLATNVAGTLITLWGLAVLWRAGPRDLGPARVVADP